MPKLSTKAMKIPPTTFIQRYEIITYNKKALKEFKPPPRTVLSHNVKPTAYTINNTEIEIIKVVTLDNNANKQ